MPDAHTAVVHELLVRYLDVWTARALHGTRAVAYAQYSANGENAADAALTALRVFGEFADRARGGQLAVTVVCPHETHVAPTRAALAAESGIVPDVVRPVVTAGSRPVLPENAAVFAYLDQRGGEPPSTGTLSALAARRGLEVLVRGPAVALDGWPWRSTVELVARDATTETLSFGTTDQRNLTTFKDELWALDEYAGIRYRDPADTERTLLDISLKPPLGPLRRFVTDCLRPGPLTLAELRERALAGTIFRPDDVTRAATDLVHNGTAQREPPGGRLALATVLRLAE